MSDDAAPAPRSNVTRRNLLAAGLASGFAMASTDRIAPAAEMETQTAFELDEATIGDLQDRMKQSKSSSRKLVELYLARIEAIDRNGPTLKSVIEINPDALAIADELDRERRAKGPRGPMHGIPVLIKDNIATADKMATTAGSLAMVGSQPPRDAGVVARLREAGAVILGKTNLSEWANARSSSSTSGWSGRGGQTKNPYALDRNPCGSSSGSGVAVAANLCAVAVGTETDGSITAPANVNGIVGMKPTVGLVSRAGIIPISASQDTAGPMTRTVRDAAILLSALAGVDPADQATADAKGHIEADYTTFLDAEGLKGAKLGVARNYFGFHDGVDRLANTALDLLKKRGASLIETSDLPKASAFEASEVAVFQYEMKAGINEYLARYGRGAPVQSLKDVIAYNEKHAQKEMPFFGQDSLVKTEARGSLNSYEYIESLAKCRRIARTEGLDAVFDKLKVDAIMAPTMGPPCPIDLVLGDHWLGGDLISIAAVAGYPHITVPMGFLFGLPVGLSFVGRAWSEATLLKLAYAYEQASKVRKPPRFLPTVSYS
ncbi:MAG: amidase [Gemmataceae bacterium]